MEERVRERIGRHERKRKKEKQREKGDNLPAVVPLCAVCQRKDY